MPGHPDFSGKEDAKAEIRAAVRYLLNGATAGDHADLVLEIIQIVRDAANGLPPGGKDPFDEELPGG